MTDPDLATLLALLDDEHVRSILAATSERPMSASELGEHCDLSTTSIYRRLDRLSDINLVGEQTRPRSDGHHESVYVSHLDRFELTVVPRGLKVVPDETFAPLRDCRVLRGTATFPRSSVVSQAVR